MLWKIILLLNLNSLDCIDIIRYTEHVREYMSTVRDNMCTMFKVYTVQYSTYCIQYTYRKRDIIEQRCCILEFDPRKLRVQYIHK